MKKYLLLLLVFLYAVLGCKTETIIETPKSIPMGSWNYTVSINGMLVGDAIVKSEQNNKHYITTVSMNMQLAEKIKIVSNDVLIETKAFVPVKYEMNSTTSMQGKTQKTSMSVTFDDNNITVVIDGRKEKLQLEKPFMLAGNYFAHSQIEKGYKTGNTVEADVYIPALELEDTIACKETVVGVEKVMINGALETLIHLKQELDDVTYSESYIDQHGIVRKIVMDLMNNKLELNIIK